MTGEQLIKALHLEHASFDWSRPHSFNQDMLKLFPEEHWSGVWFYPPNIINGGQPRPLTRTALIMLKGFNVHYGTDYNLDYEVIQ